MDEETPVIETVSTVTIGGVTKDIADPVARAKIQALMEIFGESSESLIDMTHPIGSVYMSFDSTSPADKFGGEWEQLENVFIRAANDTETGGADEITLTVGQMPAHTHTTKEHYYWSGPGTGTYKIESGNIITYGAQESYGAGGSKPHSIMPAYQDVYVWQRVA